MPIDIEGMTAKLLQVHGKDAAMIAGLWASNARQAGEGERYTAWFAVMEKCKAKLNGSATPCTRIVDSPAPIVCFPNEVAE